MNPLGQLSSLFSRYWRFIRGNLVIFRISFIGLCGNKNYWGIWTKVTKFWNPSGCHILEAFRIIYTAKKTNLNKGSGMECLRVLVYYKKLGYTMN